MLAAGDSNSAGTQQKSKKEFSTVICLESAEEVFIAKYAGAISPQWFWWYVYAGSFSVNTDDIAENIGLR